MCELLPDLLLLVSDFDYLIGGYCNELMDLVYEVYETEPIDV